MGRQKETDKKTCILGIDPGFGRMGFGCLSGTRGQYRPEAFGVITTKASTPFPKRLTSIAKDVEEIIKTHKPDIVGIERLYFSKNTKTAMQVAEARGVAVMTVAKYGIRVLECGPSQIKLAVTGNGSADKQAVQEMVKRTLNLSRIPKPDDAADALAVAITAGTMRWQL